MGLIRIYKQFIRYIKKDNLLLEQFAIGINSFIDKKNNFHCVMLDYDGCSLNFVTKDVKELQEHFKIGDVDVFSTSQGFHCFGWYDSIPYERLRMIVDYSNCDPMFKYISRYYDHKTIRASGKYQDLDTKFIKRIISKHFKPVDTMIGELKRNEYLELRDTHKILNKKGLKENVEISK